MIGAIFLKRENNLVDSMQGQITDVNIWNYTLSLEQMKNWTRCITNPNEVGNVISWETAEWAMYGLKEETLTRKEICQQDKKLVMFKSPKKTLQKSTKFCNVLGGNLAVADNNGNAEKMTRVLMAIKNSCDDWHTTWAGYDDMKQEGIFLNVITGKKMVWKNWVKNQPNGGREQNCVLMTASEGGKFQDSTCQTKACTICNVTRRAKYLKLRGSCPEDGSIYDNQRNQNPQKYNYKRYEQNKAVN